MYDRHYIYQTAKGIAEQLRTNLFTFQTKSRCHTVNGKEDTVILSHEAFFEQQEYIAQLESRLSVYAHLAQASDDVKLGRVQDMDDAFDDILSELDGIEL